MTGPGGGASMDPVRVRAGAAKFDGAADQLEQAANQLQQALQAAGACWGADEAGQQFATDYQPGAQGAGEAMTALQEALRGLREQVQGAAKDFEETDRGNAQDLGGLGA